MRAPTLLRAIRWYQWSKNGLVIAPLIFALGDPAQTVGPFAPVRALLACAAFCLLSSAIYLLNDVQDVERDRLHPRKRLRPIAAGELSPRKALRISLGLAVLSVAIAGVISSRLVLVLVAYTLLQLAYTFRIKHLAYLDVIVLSFGFVLRALAGAVAIPVRASPWLLICTFTLALFLALGKRRQEKNIHPAEDDNTRPSLRHISPGRLDQMLTFSLVLAVGTYAAYTLSPEVVARHGSMKMLLTLPFVVAGLLRYRFLVLWKGMGERPEWLLLHDPWLVSMAALYGITVLALLHR